MFCVDGKKLTARKEHKIDAQDGVYDAAETPIRALKGIEVPSSGASIASQLTKVTF